MFLLGYEGQSLRSTGGSSLTTIAPVITLHMTIEFFIINLTCHSYHGLLLQWLALSDFIMHTICDRYDELCLRESLRVRSSTAIFHLLLQLL